MWWVWIIVGAAVAGVVMLVLFAVALWRKALAVLDALGELGSQVDAALALVDGVGAPPRTF